MTQIIGWTDDRTAEPAVQVKFMQYQKLYQRMQEHYHIYLTKPVSCKVHTKNMKADKFG